MGAFTRFEGFGAKMSPRVSIRTNGQIGLSRGFLKKLGITGDGWKAELFYDAEGRRIGIRPTRDAEAEFAVPVLYRAGREGGGPGSAPSGQISGRSFLETYQIQYRDVTRKYDPVWDAENQLFVIDLKTERLSQRRRRKAGGEPGAEGKDDPF